MNESELLKILGDIKAIIKDSHIVYTSGKHGSAYVNKDAIYPHTDITRELTKAMAQSFADQGVDVVVAPVVGGVILSQWVAYHLSEIENKKVLGVYAEKTADASGFELRRGYAKLVEGKKVLVVEDILNTGGSVKKVVDMLKPLQAKVIGVAAICNRGNVKPEDVGAPMLKSLLNISLEAWNPEDCPLCVQKIPVNTEVGKGKKVERLG